MLALMYTCRESVWKSVVLSAFFFIVFILFTHTVVAQTIFVNPHGSYDEETSGCAACHVAHSGLRPQLLSRSEITVLCLSCHDGSASNYDVANIYDVSSGNNSFHPVVSTGNPDVEEIVECVDCHNPHGQNPRLLRSSDGTNLFTEGPTFCLACHGSTRRSFLNDPAGDYWDRTLGDHINNNNAAHYNTDVAYLLPASGTQVTCVICHEPHGAPQARLLDRLEEDLCRSCHWAPTDQLSIGHPIRFFDRTGSTHNVDRTGESQLGCTSCHGPHTVNSVADTGCANCHNLHGDTFGPYRLQGTMSVISDPRNTKALFTAEAGTGLGDTPNTTGDLSDFCMNCHTGTPPEAVNTSDTFIPYTIVFPATNLTTNSGGWNKGDYKTSSHGQLEGANKITCADCHESHGSDYPALVRYDEDTATENIMCLRCHDGNVAQKNISADLLKAYRHPTLYQENKHSNTENYQNMPLVDRHAECADCHDPHQATGTAGTPPAAGGPIAGVSGVRINWGTTTWSNWPGNAAFTLVAEVDYQYDLCFKCHSYYSYSTNPPDSVSRALNDRSGGKQVDVAKEFNPNNSTYHAVVGSTKNATYSSSGTRAYGYLNPNWERRSEWQSDTGTVADTRSTARLYCTDCHASNNTSILGPHGSANPFILVAPWNPNTGSNGLGGTGGSTPGDTSDHLCFKCHDYSFYAANGSGWSADGGSSTRRSAFSNGANYNLHTSKHSNQGCAGCHGAVPHGGDKRSMLVVIGDEAPYNEYSILGIKTFQNAGSWSCISCHTGGGGS